MRKLPPKARGELAEIRFLLAAALQGFIVAKPWGDSQPFDFLVGIAGRYLRVQVKSTTFRLKGKQPRYIVGCDRPCGKRAYTPREVDIIAAYVVPEDKWFLIPIRALKGVKGISVSSSSSHKGRFDQYLDAWHLLRQ